MENSIISVPTTYRAEVNIFENASQLRLTAEESKSLVDRFDDGLIEIRPDGMIFLPQVFWRQRLNTAIGIGQWALIVKGQHKDPDQSKDKLYVEGVLIIRGAYVATAVGEAELHSDNRNQSWASVWESAKSDCITRCCKDLGIACELWQPQFIKQWQKKYAMEVWCKMKDGKNKKMWRKKTSEQFWNEQGQPEQKQEPTNGLSKKQKPNDSDDQDVIDQWKQKINECKTIDELKKVYTEGTGMINNTPELFALKEKRKKELHA